MFKGLLFILAIVILLGLPRIVLARVTPDDTYQETRSEYENSLSKIADPAKKQKIEDSDKLLQTINQDICSNFDKEINKMAAILDEEKRRQNVTSTRVAYGQGNTPLDNAEYYLNFAEEAVAYQKIQDYTPQISGNTKAGIQNSLTRLLSDLNVLQGKVIKAKTEINTALDYYEVSSSAYYEK